MSGIFNASIFNSTVFNTGEAAAALAPGAIGGGRRARGKRRILPDGSSIYATDIEMVQILRNFRRQRAIEAKRAPIREIAPHIVVKPSAEFKLPGMVFEDERRLKQLREEEEFILLIHESARRSH